MADIYKTAVKKVLVHSLRSVFPKTFTGVSGFKIENIGIEFPMVVAQYPAIVVKYTEQTLERSGIGHVEVEGSDESLSIHRRWYFTGQATFEFWALNAFELDALTDGFVKAVGFTDVFKEAVASDPLVAINVLTDSINPAGESDSLGTPWGTNDYLGYASYSLPCSGEFYVGFETHELVSRVDAYITEKGHTPVLPIDSAEADWV